MAQSDSNWENYARDPKSIGENDYVYLYNVTQKQFLNSGGAYGMHGILNPRGIRLALESEVYYNTNYYYLKGPIVNDAQGSYLAMVEDASLGDVIYIDRAKDNDARFTIETIGGKNTFRIHNARNSAYWTYDTSKNYVTVTSWERDADVWCLISIEDYRTFTQEQAHVGDYNVSGLLYNTRFIRNVSDPKIFSGLPKVLTPAATTARPSILGSEPIPQKMQEIMILTHVSTVHTAVWR